MPSSIVFFVRVIPAIFVLTNLVWANPAPATSEASRLIASAISTRKFAGAKVENILITEPEKKGGVYLYRGEFNVAKAGKKVSCEDWTFTLERQNGAWIVGDIARGRCND